ncbi:Penicillin-binding protein 1A [invertebrate metagenome]|uniref:Penicillin-binding protein 1A n=1 Tax=invertebrate metagenome TaxID=1711999 RepID=A0A2H9T9D7_9ZZZZ
MKRFRKLLVYLLWCITGSISAGLVVVASAYLYLSPSLPSVETLRDIHLQTPLRVYSRDHQLIAEFGEMRRTPVQFEDIPPLLAKAFMAAEDDGFYRHHGVDLSSLARASIQLVTTGRIQSGGSTITMQVAKNFFLSHRRVFSRKFNEILLALQIERELNKNDIFELYLNKIYLGNRSYGVQAAAQVYYGKPIKELSLAQLSMIAGLPKAPSRYNPLNDPDRSLIRRNWILGRMQELGYITDAEYQQAVNQPVTAKYHGHKIDLHAPYIAEMVRQEMVERFGAEAYTEGFMVFTTVDSRLQRAANDAVSNGLMAYNERHGYRGPDKNLVGQGKTTEKQWTDELSDMSRRNNLLPAVVIEVREKNASILLKKGEYAGIDWDNLNWAKPFLNVDAFGYDPKKAAEVLKVGDVIWVRKMPDERYRLAQEPLAQSALVSMDPENGSILSLVGGFNFYDSMYNRAIQAVRQAGSAFKPFVYAAGIANGMTAATIINDAPVVFQDDNGLEGPWRPNNDNMRFNGPMRLREGLYRSRNMVSIRVLQQTGLNNAIRYMKQLGFKDNNLAKDLSLALGNVSMTPMALANGFAVMANGGYQVMPYLIDRVEVMGEVFYQAIPTVAGLKEPEHASSLEQTDHDASLNDVVDNQLLSENQEVSDEETALSAVTAIPARQVMDPRVSYIIGDILNDVIWKGTGRRAQALNRRDIGGKTGTTNDSKDVWFSGFNPSVLTTVWMGMDDSTTLGRWEYGANAALPIWLDYMEVALKDKREQRLPQPDGIVTLKIDSATGKLARKGDSSAVFEIFRKEYAPTSVSEEEVPSLDESGSGFSPEDLF